jgi:hypothetical protein
MVKRPLRKLIIKKESFMSLKKTATTQPPIKEAYAQLITAIQTVGNHPDCDDEFTRKLCEFENEFCNHLYSLAQDNERLPEFEQRAGVLNVLLQQAFA